MEAVDLHERLTGVLGLVDILVPGTNIPVSFHEDTGKGHGEVGIGTGARVGSGA